MASNQLTYAGLTINFQRFKMYKSEKIYSDDGTTPLYNHITASVEGTINLAYTGSTNATYLRTLRTVISEPRQPLNILIGGEQVVNTNGIDAKNGPNVTECSIVQIYGTASVAIGFTVECWLSECDGSGYQPDPVISNRWEQHARYNDEGMCTLTTTGQLIVRSDANVNVDTFRELVGPIKTIPKGFVREDFDPAVSSDGLTFQYTVTDREHYRPPTFGVFKYEGRWAETVDYAESALVTGIFEGVASSNKALSKDQLLNWLVQVASARIDFTKDIIRSSSMEELLHTNEVRLRVQVWTAVQDLNNSQFQITTRIGAKVPILDNNTNNRTVMTSRGTYNAQLFVNYLAGTCQGKLNSVTPGTAASQKPAQVGQDYTIITGPQSTQGTTKVSAQQLQNPYTWSKIECSVTDDYHMIQLAVANGSTTAAAAFCQTAAPTTIKIVRYEYDRITAFPELPGKINDGNHVLMKRNIIGCSSDILADGTTKLVRMRGEDIYGLKNFANLGTAAFTLPRSPTDSTPLQDSSRVVTSSAFSNNIVN